MLNEKLQALKKSSGKTNKEISLITGIPESTISKIISGETANPLFQNVIDIVKAMGGSADALAEINMEQPKEKESGFVEMIISHYEQDLIHERKLNRLLLIAMFVIIAFLIVILLIDVSNGGIGFIRY